MHAIYDLRLAPLSFDFLNYLAFLYMYSKINRFERIDLELVCPNFRHTTEIEKSYPPGYNERKLFNVCVDLVPLADFIENFLINRSGVSSITKINYKHIFPEDYDHSRIPLDYKTPITRLPVTEKVIWQSFNLTKIKPLFLKSTDKAKAYVKSKTKGKQFISLTLRKTPYNSARNISDDVTANTYKFLNDINENISVVVIPDQDDFFGLKSYKNSMWDFWEEAALDLDIRLALYTGSLFNVAFSTGPAMLLLYSENKHLILGTNNKKSSVSTVDFFSRKGPEFEKQRPWSKSDQKVDWTEYSELENKKNLTKILCDYVSLVN